MEHKESQTIHSIFSSVNKLYRETLSFSIFP
jgi:hypothetical protein